MILIHWETPRKSDAIALDRMSIHFETKHADAKIVSFTKRYKLRELNRSLYF